MEKPARWLALDAVKTISLLGTVLVHILIWWYGINLAKEGAFLFSLDTLKPLGLFYFPFVGLLIMSSGSAFYFYIHNKKTSWHNIIKRCIILMIIGFIWGLNTEPFIIWWNIFLFYSISLFIIAFIYKKWNIQGIITLTTISFFITPLLKSLSQSINYNYFLYALIGDPKGIISTFPIFPWIFVLGIGFSIAYFFNTTKENNRYKWILFILGSIIMMITYYFLPQLDLSNVFGVTAQISMLYPLYFSGLFIFLITLLDKVLKNKKLSLYNPIRTIGGNLLPVYLITILTMLGITDYIQNNYIYQRENSQSIFFILNILTLVVVYVTSFLLTKRKINRTSDN